MTRAVVVVGAGHSGVALAAALRAAGFDGELTLVSDESGPPYQRPPLSKTYLAGGTAEDALWLRPPPFFAERGIALIEADAAVAIDRSARRLLLASGRSVPYDALVLAVGARNRALPVPGAPAGHDLRTLADARRLRERLGTGGRTVVIGAGFIGLEFAATAAKAGHTVTVVDAAPRALGRSVSLPVAERLTAYHRALGVAFRFGVTIEAIEEDGGWPTAVRLAGERLGASLVVVGIGVTPNTALAKDAGLAVADGILVDGTMATSDPSVFAIGDCARHRHAHGAGASVRLESVQNANDTARLLAAVLTGGTAPAPPVPWFWSDQGEAKLQIAGLGAQDDCIATTGSGGLDLTALRYRDGVLAAVETINRPGDHMAARRLIGSADAPSYAAAAGGTVDLRSAARGRRR
ncbi:NAD(P)/FAD-dependent oxidoreductase [Acuticoccus sp.]|uniref:NAD(P)/FAD-dependent oxidoreductase n=1 Tax=Acuticoccus sp. TaxID=1904378 RepID=UPI003B51A147